MDFTQIGFLFAVASIFGIIAAKLKQPLFLGYLVAGVLLKLLGLIDDPHSLEQLGHIGISLLLFLLGLEMNLRDISSVGKPAAITGISQVLINFLFAFILGKFAGFDTIASFYIGVALTFSSTIIAVKLISEKDDLESLYGRLAVGILLVQDLFAVFILLILGNLGQGHPELGIDELLLKGSLLVFLVWFISKRVLPGFFEIISKTSQELLFIVSISWALGFSAFVAKYTGFSIEIGGFLAGLSLSGLSEHLQIASKTKSIRDFFLTIYFLILGTTLVVRGEGISILPNAFVFAVFVVLSHIFIMLFLLGLQGFKRRTSFFVGTSASQMSEFSLIIATIGLSLGHLEAADMALIAVTAVITMVVSTYLINNSEKIYNFLKEDLWVFEKDKLDEFKLSSFNKMENHTVLVGCDRTGRQLVKYFDKNRMDFVVIDFNPNVVKNLEESGRNVIFGDFNDTEVLELAGIEKAKLVILTTSNTGDNLTFLEYMRSLREKPVTVFTASMKSDAIALYKAGASFVIVPGIVAGDYIKHLIKVHLGKEKALIKSGKLHYKRLADL